MYGGRRDTPERFGKPVSVCGEMAGDPAAAILLLGMRVDALSVKDLERAAHQVGTTHARS